VAQSVKLVRAPDRQRKILCIEDESEIARLIRDELADLNFDVSIAHDGPEGLSAIMRDTPDLILCDVKLPSMTGFDLLERLNELAPRLGRIPVVLCTAVTDQDSELKGRLLGADDYVTKPIDFERLISIINARIEHVARNKLVAALAKLDDSDITVLTQAARGRTYSAALLPRFAPPALLPANSR